MEELSSWVCCIKLTWLSFTSSSRMDQDRPVDSGFDQQPHRRPTVDPAGQPRDQDLQAGRGEPSAGGKNVTWFECV